MLKPFKRRMKVMTPKEMETMARRLKKGQEKEKKASVRL
jgi:hypothetical protein